MPATPSFADRLAQFALHRYWHALPDLQDAYQLNPFSYAQRIGAYKLLIDAMNSKTAFGADNEFNMFWGFITQLDWQWRSGRLYAPATNPQPITPNLTDEALIAQVLNDNIALASWWGCCNYSLSIIPLIAAMQVGILPQIEILLPAAPDNTALSVELKFAQGGGDAGGYSVPAPFKKPVEEWRAFFKLVKKAKAGDDLEPLRMASWHAHLLSITAATKLYLPEQRLLSRQEQAFGRGWIRMVDFLGAAAWRTDLAFLTDEGQGNLPPRMLQDGDKPGQIADMDAATNGTLQSVFALGRMTRVRFAFNRWIWTRAMRTREARANAPRLLRASFDPSPDYAADRKQLQKYIRARGKKEV